jgi:hypothetical protein
MGVVVGAVDIISWLKLLALAEAIADWSTHPSPSLREMVHLGGLEGKGAVERGLMVMGREEGRLVGVIKVDEVAS